MLFVLYRLVSPFKEAHTDQSCFLWLKMEFVLATGLLLFYFLYPLKKKVIYSPVGLCIVLAPLLKQAVYQYIYLVIVQLDFHSFLLTVGQIIEYNFCSNVA